MFPHLLYVSAYKRSSFASYLDEQHRLLRPPAVKMPYMLSYAKAWVTLQVTWRHW
jgi:hypothetical protein